MRLQIETLLSQEYISDHNGAEVVKFLVYDGKGEWAGNGVCGGLGKDRSESTAEFLISHW